MKEVQKWFRCDSKVDQSAFTYLPLSNGDKQNFFYKKNIRLITIPRFYSFKILTHLMQINALYFTGQ